MEEVASQVLVNVLENHLSTSCNYKKYSRTLFLLYLYGFLFMEQQKDEMRCRKQLGFEPT